MTITPSVTVTDTTHWKEHDRMSELDKAMWKYIEYLVNSEGRPFCFKDFLIFSVDGISYRMVHGTFRNKVSKLIREGKIEVYFRDFLSFYTIKGIRFAKQMTSNHTEVNHNNPFYRMLQELPLDKQSIHDIHLKFKVPHIWKILSLNPDFTINERSKDILLPYWRKNNAIIRITIHKTDTVSIVIGCTLEPIPLDFNGIITFFNLLVGVEEKLQTILDSSIPVNCDNKCNSIPGYKSWIVTMWHFGRDSLTEYSGKQFSVTMEEAQESLTRAYVKQINGKRKIRLECHESPQKPVEQIVRERVYRT